MKNLKISRKLAVAFGAVIFLICIVGVVFFNVLKSLERNTVELNTSIKFMDAVNLTKLNISDERLFIMEVLGSESKEDMEKQAQRFENNLKAMQSNLAELTKFAEDKSWGEAYESQKQNIIKLSAAFTETHKAQVEPAFRKMHAMATELMAISQIDPETKTTVGTNEEIRNLEQAIFAGDDKFDELVDVVEASLVNIDNEIDSIQEGALNGVSSTMSFAIITLVVVVLVLIAVSVIGGVLISRSIALPVAEAVRVAEKIAEGDLTVNIEATQKDEIGDLMRAMNTMSTKLQDVIGYVVTAAEGITLASDQMSASAQQMSEGATEQASSVEEISSSMEEMVANIQQNTSNAKLTEKIATNAAKDVSESNEAVGNTVETMKVIAGKISIIGEISRQTNLLALNAAVEAARAGEHGKGFAVVAAEVRKLAERSQLAATEINEVSSKSVDIAQKSGQLLSSVVPTIQKTADLVQEISASSTEQNAGSDQVNNAIQHLNQVVQENAATAEQMAAGAEELNSQAEGLKDMVGFFKLKDSGIGSKSAQRTHSTAPRSRTAPVRKSVASKGKPAPKVNLEPNEINLNDSEYESF